MQSVLPATLAKQIETFPPDEPIIAFVISRTDFNQMLNVKRQMSAEQWQQFAEWVESSTDGSGRSTTDLMIGKHHEFIAKDL
jgi:hypothetical protein